MSRFQKLQEFEKRFETTGVHELKQWRDYWIYHAQGLVPKIRKQAMKRIYEIDKALEHRTQKSD